MDPSQWVDKYGDLMYRYTVARVRNRDEAEEIVQATLLSALQSQSTYSAKSTEKNWLFGILKHKIYDHFRFLQKNPQPSSQTEDEADPLGGAFNSEGGWIHPPSSWSIGPEQAVENEQMLKLLRLCLDALPERHRRIIVMKEMDEADSEIICKEFSILPTNLWVILHRARHLLKSCFESHLPEIRVK